MNLTLALAIAIGVALVAILVVLLFAYGRRQEEIRPNYRTLFTVGIIWTGAGVALGASSGYHVLWPIGLVFMAVGLANRDDWEAETSWSELSREEKRLRLILGGSLGLLLILGAILFFMLAMT